VQGNDGFLNHSWILWRIILWLSVSFKLNIGDTDWGCSTGLIAVDWDKVLEPKTYSTFKHLVPDELRAIWCLVAGDNSIIVLEVTMLGGVVPNINANNFPTIVAALVGKGMVYHIIAMIIQLVLLL
jgi:hypothetical protein